MDVYANVWFKLKFFKISYSFMTIAYECSAMKLAYASAIIIFIKTLIKCIMNF